jgi:hypothetical protein
VSAVITTYEDIVNAALAKLKAPIRVGKLTEGSVPAKIALDTIGQTRDQMLREGNWGFARRDVAMTVLKSAPAGGYIVTAWDPVTYPPIPWKYAYEYPADCLKVRAVKAQPTFLPDFDPAPVVFDTPNTQWQQAPPPADPVEVKCVACNVPSAILTYTGQILDPVLWEPGFVEAMISAMADVLAPAIAPEAVQLEKAEEMADEMQAAEVQG